jgi:uncharacterized protein YfaA (DUF2138 family)
MRRAWLMAGFVGCAVAAVGVITLMRPASWQNYHFKGAGLMVDLAAPDALIRSNSLSKLPRDLLKVPLLRAVATEDLLFYYEQHEDRLGLNGALKRIAYEHQLQWSDKIVQSVFDEPAEVALWRDGKGALRHYAVLLKRNWLSKTVQEALKTLADDAQLKRAANLKISGGEAEVLILELNPRRTLVLISRGERMVVLSDPGLLFESDDKVAANTRNAIGNWLEHDGALAQQFALDKGAQGGAQGRAAAGNSHTMVIGTPTLALGYASFVPGIKGLRFDFGKDAGKNWSSALWLDAALKPHFGDAALWQAAPANPAACALLPVDWASLQKVVNEADKKPALANPEVLNGLRGAALACWYRESGLYTPVFIARLQQPWLQRDITLPKLAQWAIASGGNLDKKSVGRGPAATLVWHANKNRSALAASGDYLVWSPDRNLVDKVLSSIGRSLPSVADQISGSNDTLALITPRALSGMAEREVFAALAKPGNDSLNNAAKTLLPPRLKALAEFAPVQVNMSGSAPEGGWQTLDWRSREPGK